MAKNFQLYDKFLVKLRRELLCDKGRKVNEFFSGPDDLSGFRQIVNSFDTSAPIFFDGNGLLVEEWNPLGQRLIVDTRVEQLLKLTKSFTDISASVSNFLVTVHESIHVLLLEAFFVGKMKFRSAEEFKQSYLGFEALAFWYSDIVVTPALRTRLPDSELVFSSRAMSSPYFHPYRALRAAGVNNKKEAMELYIRAFTGYRSPLLKQKDIFSKNLAERLHQFYFVSDKPTRALYQSLRETGVFHEFQERFCSIANLPTLLPEDVLACDPQTDMYDFAKRVFGVGMKAISKTSDSQVNSVRIRRRAQSRAYYVHCMRKLIEANKVFSRKAKIGAAVKSDLLAKIDHYLDLIEGALRGPLSAGKVTQASQAILQADIFYKNKVGTALNSLDLWVSTRGFYINKNSQNISLSDMGSVQKIKEAEINLAQLLLSGMQNNPAELDTFQRSLVKLQKIRQSRVTPAIKAKRLESFARSEPVASLWSLPLASVDPANCKFRELLFNYA